MSGNSTSGDGSAPAWFKSSYSSSSGDGNSCVEVATTPGTIHVRDSKHRDAGPRLALAPQAWADFVAYASGN
ncbi:DUF397 domain-containing protein [Streptomyces gilvus]|uniref:DUF397 domain-containing protein n=1 Tax=Streptomyces gilvus TaxID=2920937 RepID=UPI001F0D3EB6|nr:DUF397 domain-containing protein [Streptomyces sp. CME 23]MCH5672508.1 DUF397 domain-containing protein [Streptomyces sp. CME 23]